MNKTYESIYLSGEDRNVERLGTFVAWLVTNDLLEESLERSAASSVARVCMPDLTGPEFLTTVLHGDFKQVQLKQLGQDFVEAYFVSGQYDADYEVCEYVGENEWLRFDEVSPKITDAFRSFKKPKSTVRSLGAKIIQFPVRSK